MKQPSAERPNIWCNASNCDLVDSDMFIPPKPERSARAMVHDEHTWPNGVILYSLEEAKASHASHLTTASVPAALTWASAEKRILAAMQIFTMLTFVENITHPNVYFTAEPDQWCTATVGRHDGYSNIINLDINNMHCWEPYIIEHEIGHLAGMYHEQSRPDRDLYLNIPANDDTVYSVSTINSRALQYDFLSLMHYTLNGIGATLTDLGRARLRAQGATANRIGRARTLSDLDKWGLGMMYPDTVASNTIAPVNEPQTSAPSSKRSSSSLGTGGIVGIVCGGVIVIGIFGAVLYRNNKKSETTSGRKLRQIDETSDTLIVF